MEGHPPRPALRGPPARALRALAIALSIPALFLAIASLPWRPHATSGPPGPAARKACSGTLAAGAAEARFDLPSGAPIAGFRRNTWASEGTPGPVGARAVVLEAGGCRFAIASGELLLVPLPLASQIRARVQDLRLDGLFLGATHTHAGPGGYWDEPIGEYGGTAPYDATMEARIADGYAQAIRAAAAALAPARVGERVVDAGALVRGRSNGDEEARLTLVRLARSDGAPVAELAVLASHPTLLGKANRRIDGDWPGRFLADAPHGLRVFLQGALGDQSAEGTGGARPEAPAYGEAVSRAADVEVPLGEAGTPVPLAFATVEVPMPDFEPGGLPGFLRPAARTLLGGHVPRHAAVTALRVGPVVLAGVPAEPVAAVGARWRARAGEDVVLVSLVNDYVGYAETAEDWAAGRGETKRTVLGPELAERLGAGVEAAVAAVR
ncbi:MAG: hypothetical protein U0229_22935 [Anaeromyxobacter sp.]